MDAKTWVPIAVAIALAGIPGSVAGQRCTPRPYLGVGYFSCDGGLCAVHGARTLRQGEGLRDSGFDYDFTVEPTLWEVDPEGPATGLLRDQDVLVAVNDRVITSVAASQELQDMRAGEPVRLLVRRDGALVEKTITPVSSCATVGVTFGAVRRMALERDGDQTAPRASAEGRDRTTPGPGLLGVSIRCEDCTIAMTSGEERPQLRFASYPEIVDVLDGSPADRAGLQPGDRLTHLGGEDVRSEAGAERLAAIGTRAGELIEVRYIRDGAEKVASVRLH